MRTLLAAAAVCLVLAPAARAADETRAVLDKAIKAHGGEDKLNKQLALHTKSKGTLDLPGVGNTEFTQEGFVQMPDKFKEVLQLQIAGQTIPVITVFDGKNAWVNVNGQNQELDDKASGEFKQIGHMMAVGRLTPLRDAKKFELSPLGESKVNGRAAVGLRVVSKGNRDVNLYFDKESGLLAKIERQALDAQSGQEVAEERIITEYKDLDGYQVPKKVVVNRDGKKFVETELLEAKSVDKHDDSTFAKP